MRGEGSSNPFSVLADETRLGVVEVLGDASGGGEYATLSYSEIRATLDDIDSGKLNYHLRKLRGRFVERTDDGYRLTLPGISVYQAISSGRFDRQSTHVEPTEHPACCPDCDGTLVFSYRDGRYLVECSSCATLLDRTALSPAAFDPEDPETLRAAGSARSFVNARCMYAGICPYCDARVETEITTDAEEFAASDYVAISRKWCTQCGWSGHSNVESVPMVHPHTRAFLLEHGFVDDPHQTIVENVDSKSRILSRNPWRIEVRIESPAGTVRHVLDESLESVEWAVLD